ncbi:hypothetical protein [uncultured Thiodictyon sp.]|uniref:hypothetical protein n=1 Tax=uncultured Thiodictyon sp. TaxID=1846217 RepID=UPI0025E21BB9|nr:hypothetical protein [uncultured Thiodictyon sp.]
MIKEYAVDPGLLANWERFRYLTENFGISNGRLISRYPKRWVNLVYAALEGVSQGDLSEMQRKRIEEKLMEIDKKMLVRVCGRDDSGDWLTNSEREHADRPFTAIIGYENPRGHDQVLVYEQLDKETNSLWKSQTEITVERTAEAVSAAVAPLLRISRHVIFIDPYFEPDKDKFDNLARTVGAFLKVCLVGRFESCRLDKVWFYTRSQDIPDFECKSRDRLSQVIPAGMVLKVTRCAERTGGQGFHNRYILTDRGRADKPDRGGVKFPWGLDEGKPGQKDVINLLQPIVVEELWSDYCGENPSFEMAPPFDIVGTRRIK